MSDFIPVLAAGIMILLGLFIAFGGIIYIAEDTAETETITSIVEDKIALGHNFTVADYQKGEELVSLKTNVSAGIVSKSKQVLSFDVDDFDFTYGRIFIDVLDTNLYGSLIMEINGNRVYDNVTLIGPHSIEFPKGILNETENAMVVRAGGSGWRIWAPTVYEFDMGVYGETSDVSEHTKEFNVTYVPEKARIRVYVADREGSGYLTAKINGYKVFRVRSNAFKTFDPDILKEGVNEIIMIADPGSKFDVESVYIVFE